MEYIEELEKSLKIKARKKFMPLQAGDVPITFADISSLEKLTAFRPQTTVADGVARFIDWYKDFYNIHL